MEFPFPTDIGAFIVWLGTAGAGGLIVSLGLEKIASWVEWKSPLKTYVTVALFVALPFLSQLLQYAYAQLDPALAAQIQGYLNLAIGGLAAWAASQVAHKFINK
jgi:hypothetical protein